MSIRFGKAVERGKKHFPKLLSVIPVSKMDEVEGVGSMAYSVSVFILPWSGVARSQTEFYRKSYHGKREKEKTENITTKIFYRRAV